MDELINGLFMISIILVFAVLIFVPFKGESKIDHKTVSKWVKLTLRILQVYFLVAFVSIFIQLNYFFFDGELGPLSEGNLAFNYHEVFEGYEIITLGYSLLFIGINIILLELFHSITKSIGANYKFTWDLVKKMRLIVVLVIVRFLLTTSLSAIVFQSLSIALDNVVILGLLVLLVHLFIQAKEVQFDSDMAI